MDTTGGATPGPSVPPSSAGSVLLGALTLTGNGNGSPPPGEGRSLAIILIAGAIPVVAGVMLLISAVGGTRSVTSREDAQDARPHAGESPAPRDSVLATRPPQADARGGDVQLPRDPSRPEPGTVVRRRPPAEPARPAAAPPSQAALPGESTRPLAGVAQPAAPVAAAPISPAPIAAEPSATLLADPQRADPPPPAGPTPAERDLAQQNRALRDEVLSLREQLDGASGRLATVVRDMDAAAQQARVSDDALERARVLLSETQRARETESARRLAAEIERDRLMAALLETHELYARLTPARIEHRRLSQRGQRLAERAEIPLGSLLDGIGDLFVGVFEAIGGPGGPVQYVAVFTGGAEVIIDEATVQRWREVGVPVIDLLEPGTTPAPAPAAVPPPAELTTPPAAPGPPVEPLPVELPPAPTPAPAGS